MLLKYQSLLLASKTLLTVKLEKVIFTLKIYPSTVEVPWQGCDFRDHVSTNFRCPSPNIQTIFCKPQAHTERREWRHIFRAADQLYKKSLIPDIHMRVPCKIEFEVEKGAISKSNAWNREFSSATCIEWSHSSLCSQLQSRKLIEGDCQQSRMKKRSVHWLNFGEVHLYIDHIQNSTICLVLFEMTTRSLLHFLRIWSTFLRK